MRCPNENAPMTKAGKFDEVTFRGIPVKFEAEHFVCPVCGFTADDIPTAAANQRALSDAYRKSAGLLTGDEIIEGRKRLGWSQERLAKAVNVGIASIKRWEKGQIQTPVMDKALRGALTGEPMDCDIFTGNRPLSLERIKLVLQRFGSLLKRDLLKGKGRGVLYAGKYLWYADMLCFSATGRSMTGATYTALPLGPQLNNYTSLEEIIRDADETSAEPLSDYEARIISRIAAAFPTDQAIYDASHKEDVWKSKKPGMLIPYSDAVYLTELG